MSVPRVAVAEAGFIGPTIGRSGYRTMAEFRDAVFDRYQGFYDQAFARVQAQVAAGRLPGDALSVGGRTDRIARGLLRGWLESEGIPHGLSDIIQVNRRLYDPVDSGAYRVPEVRIPGANVILDGTISPSKSLTTRRVVDFYGFSGGNNVIIVKPSSLGGYHGIVFP